MAAWGGIFWVLFKGTATSIHLALGIYSAGLFVCCMVCHGELYRLRPDPRLLTGFYLMIAAGGALGGLFVAVIAPLIFNDFFELPWGLVFCCLLFLVILVREWSSGIPEQRRWLWGNVQHLRALGCAGLAIGLAAFGVELWLSAQPPGPMRMLRTRNFYGVLTILKFDDESSNTHYLELLHGRTMHGLQFTDPAKAAWPTLYYSEKSGVGLALQALPAGNRRIGVIGLGVGTLADYPRAGDYLHVYEINPEVERIANTPFTCLAHCQGTVEITLGDGRLSLEWEPPQDFDLLALDAFNGDAIPVHLLTREAFVIYGQHLKTNGIIAMHVSNRSLNLEPVIVNLARQFNYEVAVIDYNAPPARPWILNSVWMLLSHSREIIDSSAIRVAARPPQTNSVNIPLWTDDFTSLFQILKSGGGPQNDSEFTETQTGIASRFCQRGDFAGAIAGYRRALQTLPRSPVLLNNLAFLLAICPDAKLRNPTEATRLAEASCQLTHYYDSLFVSTLAAVYSEAGRFPEAVATAEKACALAGESDDPDGLKQNRALLELYRAHRPYHEAASPGQPKSSAVNSASGNPEQLVPAVP
jgi:spermidine synthase